MIASQEISLALPAETNALQWSQVERVVQYAEGKGVAIKITKVE